MAGISLRDAEAARLQITREQAAEVQNMYRRVYKDYRAWLKSMTSGGATTSLRKTQLKKLTEELKTAYEGLGRQLEGNITSAVTQTSQAVVQANNSWMSGMGLKVTGAYAHVPQDIVVLLASGKLYSDGWTLSKAIWGESQQKAHEIDLIVAKGVALNKSAFDIAKDLESYVNPGAIKPWDWSKVYPGTSKKVDYNAQRLARTMVSHAYQQSLERVCNKNPFVIGYKWRSAHTARTCEICNQRSTEDHHGLGPGVYPKGELPLDHPNGMCTFLTVMSDDLEGISNRLADWANGKEDPELDGWFKAMGGKVLEPKKAEESKQKPKSTEKPTEDVVSSPWIRKHLSNMRKNITKTYGKQYWEDLEKYLLTLDEEKLRWLSIGNGYLKSMVDGDGFYSPGKKSISCSIMDLRGIGPKRRFTTFFHEYGHLTDHKNFGGSGVGWASNTKSRGLPIYKAIERDYNKFINPDGTLPYSIFKELRDHHSTNGVQDIIDGMSRGKNRIYWGHGRDYWLLYGEKDSWKQVNIEAWAHFNQAYIMGGESEEAMRKYFPEAYEMFLKEVKDAVGKMG